MNYDNIRQGTFRERPNRFIAYVDIDGKRETVHVKKYGAVRRAAYTGGNRVCAGGGQSREEDRMGPNCCMEGRSACEYGFPGSE